MSHTCIVIPCYNEEDRFEKEVFIDFIQQHEDFDFLFVNDGSSDQTSELLQSLNKEHPQRLHLLDNDINKGKANAVRDGMLMIREMKKYDYAGYLDADLEIPIEEILRITEAVKKEGKIMAMGSRIIRLGADIKRETLRHILGRVFATFTSNILGVPLYDSQCGAKVFRTDIIPIAFDKEFLSKWLFDVEILFRIKKSEQTDIWNVVEVPLNRMVVKGSSRIKFLDVLKFPTELLRIYFHYK
jgi:glycosyltransferase involved in cell wall biosynthesis